MKAVYLTDAEVQAVLELFDAGLKHSGLKLCKNAFVLGTKFETAEEKEPDENDSG